MSARKKQPKKRTKAVGKRAPRGHGGGRTKASSRSAKPAKKPKSASGRGSAAKQASKKKVAAAAKQQAQKLKLAREREKAQKAKEKERAQKEREREKAAAAREREKALKEREREKAQQAKEKERQQKEREREKAQKAKEKERQLKLEAAEKARKKKEADAERAREKAEKEAERKRLIAEREAEKEAARRAKEEERARREAEREAYRKAKEAERERLRAEREAARRVREGKVARASRAAQKMDGLRMGSTRVYDPAAIPNQSGTTRHTGASVPIVHRLVGVRHVDSAARSTPAPQVAPTPAPPPLPERRPTPPPSAPVPPVAEGIEERYRRILERLGTGPEALKKEYEETLEMSWIHHDSALEGVVYTFQELRAAMDPTSASTPDSSMQPVCEEIRRHRQAIAYVRDLGERKRVPLNVDVVKRLFVMLHPEEGDVKTVKYRKDIPQHRLYFHEYAAPDKIAYRVRQIMDWLNGPEAKKMKNPLRVGARVHYDLLRVFPFSQDSGKVARLLMNIVLLRGGYPPSIVHSTERQRYYEALKGQLPVIIQLVNESIMNALASIEKRLDDEARAAS
jgi:hypothetical protein